MSDKTIVILRQEIQKLEAELELLEGDKEALENENDCLRLTVTAYMMFDELNGQDLTVH